MATFVLVHGHWHGGWCWKKVRPLLCAAGHDVLTPTLTGAGERSHLLAPSVALETNIQDIIGVLEYEDLQNVVVVGHSYGGMVITGVADRVPEQIAHTSSTSMPSCPPMASQSWTWALPSSMSG